jgi:hypothetical protein
MVCTPDPELPGGSTALVAIDNKIVGTTWRHLWPTYVSDPNSCLTRETIAFNKRVVEKEDETAAINSGFPDFLVGFSLAKPICGQLWIQKDRCMVLPDTGTSREAVTLAEISDAPTWRHLLEPNQEYRPDLKSPGERFVIYLAFLTQFGLVLSTGNPGIDPQEELWPVNQAILSHMDTRQDDCKPATLPENDPFRQSCKRRQGRLRNGWKRCRRLQWQEWKSPRRCGRTLFLGKCGGIQ